MPELKDAAIERLARCWRDRYALLIVVLAGLGTAHILVRTATYGAAVGTDSIVFLSTALNFLAGEGWRDFTGVPMVVWPPLFPLLLAALGWVGLEPLAAGRWVNAAAFGLTILAAGCWLRSNVRSQGLALAATATLAASLPLSDWASNYMTEPLFVLLTLLALIQLAAFLQRGGRTPLLWAAVFTALAALTRYPGVVLIGTGVLILWPLARWKQVLVFGAASSVPLLAVLAHNWTVSATWTGDRSDPVRQSLSEGLRQTVEVFRTWIVPPNAPDGVAYLLWLAIGLVVLAGTAVVLHTLRRHRDVPEATPVYFRLGPVLPFGVFALIYFVFIIVVVPLTIPYGIGDRLLLPGYVPLLLTAGFLLDRFLCIAVAGWMVPVRYGLASLVLLATLTHLCFSARENLRLTTHAWVAGYPAQAYNAAAWQQSETLNYLRDHHIEGRIYSNHRPLAWFADRTAAYEKYQPIRAGLPRLARDIMQWTEDGTHIVWFRAFHNRGVYGYDLMDLRLLSGVEPVAELADGVVFRATTSEPFDAERHRARKQRYVQELIEQAGESVVRAGWDVYLKGRKLTYFKEPCAPADTQAMFVLHAIPLNPADLPAHRRPYGFDLLDFYFDWRGGVRLDDQCGVIAQLPDYAIGRIRVGQWIAAENRTLWETTAEPFDAKRHQRYVEQLIAQADEQVARAGWGVYRNGRKLIYRKQPCAPDDVQAKFILHVTPADPNELPANRQRHGFESLGFYFDQRGFQLDDQCIAIAQLPAYAIDRIRGGQWIAKGNRTVWEAEFSASR